MSPAANKTLLTILLLLATCAAAGLSACGGGKDGLAASSGTKTFKVRSLADPLLAPDAAPALLLSSQESGSELEVQVHTDKSSALHSFYFELEYDAAHFTPLGVDSAGVLGAKDKTLSISLSTQPGLLQYGEVQLHPAADAAGGQACAAGTALATLRFARKPFSAPRSASSPPLVDASACKMDFDEETSRCTWYYYSQGDYNQDGVVSAQDLTPIGIHFGANVPADQPNSIEAVVDGNGDGKVTVGDLTPIGINFQTKVDGFNLYADQGFDNYPGSNSSPSTLEPRGAAIEFSEKQGDPAAGRLSFIFDIDLPPPSTLYWVRPYDDVVEGTPSNFDGNGLFGDNLQPVAEFTADHPAGPAPVTVNFDAGDSYDPDGANEDISDIVSFEWDFDGDGVYDETTDQPTTDHQYLVSANFLVTLRVTDAKGGVDTTQREVNYAFVLVLGPTGELVTEPPLNEDGLITGPAILDVDFDASGVFDYDGTIANYQWDFEDDATYDVEGADKVKVTHSYPAVGDYTAKLTATDNDGHSHDFMVNLKVGSGLGLDLVVTPDSGTAPLDVELKGEAFNPNDFPVAQVRVDYSGDGTWDSTGTSLTVQHSYEPGVYYPKMEVTFDDGNNTKFLRIGQVNAKGWSTTTVIDPADTEYFGGLSAAMIAGRPAVAYGLTAYTPFGTKLYYRAAKLPFGTAWDDPVLVRDRDGESAYASLAEIGGRPALCLSDSTGLYYLRASDPYGSSWSNDYEIFGQPVIFGSTRLVELGSVPAVVFTFGTGFTDYGALDSVLAFNRATAADGKHWDSYSGIDFDHPTGQFTKVNMIDGRLAVSYTHEISDFNHELRYRRAQDALANSWTDPEVVASNDFSGDPFVSMPLARDGGIDVLYYEPGDYSNVGRRVSYKHSDSPDGGSFGAAHKVLNAGLNDDSTLFYSEVAGKTLVGTVPYSQIGQLFRQGDTLDAPWETLPVIPTLVYPMQIIDVNGKVGVLWTNGAQIKMSVLIE